MKEANTIHSIGINDIQEHMYGTNNELMVFMLHKGYLFYWKEGMGNKIKPVIETTSKEFIQLRNDQFIIRSDIYEKGKEPVFCLKKYKIMFSDFQDEFFYEEKYHSV